MQEDPLSVWKAAVSQGIDQHALIQAMHDAGVSIGLCIKYIVDLYKIRLGEAKKIVADHPCWKQVHEAHRQLHEEVVNTILKDGEGG
jgi:hypothetical protein